MKIEKEALDLARTENVCILRCIAQGKANFYREELISLLPLYHELKKELEILKTIFQEKD